MFHVCFMITIVIIIGFEETAVFQHRRSQNWCKGLLCRLLFQLMGLLRDAGRYMIHVFLVGRQLRAAAPAGSSQFQFNAASWCCCTYATPLSMLALSVGLRASSARAS
jgi:hypothetical protein